jgi:diguanylate cyclase (GGDEF)-like protein
MRATSLLIGSGAALVAAGAAAGHTVASRRLRKQLRTDALTGAVNRAGLFADLRRRSAADQSFVLAMVDLDKFKQVNDTLGHATGDTVLVEVARRLRRVADAPGAIVARLSGDEFVIVAASPSAEVSTDLGAAIVFALAEPWDCLARAGLAVTGSVGLVHGLPGDDPRALLATADYAMYDAKTCGGDQVVEYDGELLEVSDRPASRWRDLRSAHRELAVIGRAQ